MRPLLHGGFPEDLYPRRRDVEVQVVEGDGLHVAPELRRLVRGQHELAEPREDPEAHRGPRRAEHALQVRRRIEESAVERVRSACQRRYG